MTTPNLELRTTLRICDACRRATAIDCDACHWCALDREEAANEAKARKSQPSEKAVPSLPAIVADAALTRLLEQDRPSPAIIRFMLQEALQTIRAYPTPSKMREVCSGAEIIAGVLNVALDEQIQLGLQ